MQKSFSAKKLSVQAPSDEGDSPQCGEMSAKADRGDRRRQRLGHGP